MKNKSAVIFLKGNVPEMRLVNKFLKKTGIVISADGASNYLIKMPVKTDVIIGDLDSIKKNVLKYFSDKGTEIIKISDQETTDFEKCLLYCGAHKIKNITVFGGLSGRADHTLNNLSVLKRYYEFLDIKLVDNDYEIFFFKKSISFKYKKGETVSFLAMPYAEKVYSTGLMYTLKGEDLEFGVREGTLNKAVSGTIKINYKSGDLILFKKHFKFSK